MILTEYKHDPKEKTTRYVYRLTHTSRAIRKRVNTLELECEVNVTPFETTPRIDLTGFPHGLSERERMLKLAEWLQRAAVDIENYWSVP